jgi:hypothetical protein
MLLCPFIYPDLATALRGILSSGPGVRAIRTSGEARAMAAIAAAIEPFRSRPGTYRLANTYRYLIATTSRA